MTNTTEHQNGYDKSDVNVKKAVIVGISIVAFIVVSLIVINEYFLSYKEKLVFDLVLSPESATLRDIRAKEDEVLNSYKLLDSAKATYRIPIDRAMEILAEEAFEASKK